MKRIGLFLLTNLAIMFVLSITTMLLAARQIKLVSFHPELATSMGIPAWLVHYAMLTLITGASVASFEAVGSILVIAMLVAPGATALLLTQRWGFAFVLASIIGALAGYFYAFPMMLQFLIGFNKWIGVSLQPRLSEYITLAMLMPLMFGISFQLPMVMVFLERIGICTVDTYKENWRIAVLIISIASMVLTTSPDPWSMLLMMIPLLFLYVLGIWLCGFKVKSPASPIR